MDPFVTLRLGTAQYEGGPGDSPVMRHFADEVEARSGGNIDVQLAYQAAGSVTDYEPTVVKLVQEGALEIGWLPTRGLDSMGVHSFQALQAPFLITDYALLRRVISSQIPAMMLAGLEALDVVGLGLYPDRMRHPAGIDRPLVTSSDFQDARIRVPTSDASDALWRALGSTPVHLNGLDLEQALAAGTLDGVETTMDGPLGFGARYVTSNLTFYPIVQVLLLSRAASRALTDRQLAVLRDAASDTLAFAMADLPFVDAAEPYCDTGGSVVVAEPAEVDALTRAVAPVTAAMEDDPETKGYLERIRALKADMTTTPAVSAICDGTAVPSIQPGLQASGLPAGTFSGIATRQDALRNGIAGDCATHHGSAALRLVIGSGRYSLFESCESEGEQQIDNGTYTSNAVTVEMSPTCCPGQSTVYSWTLADGVLTLTVVDESNSPPGDIPFNHFLYEHQWHTQIE